MLKCVTAFLFLTASLYSNLLVAGASDSAQIGISIVIKAEQRCSIQHQTSLTSVTRQQVADCNMNFNDTKKLIELIAINQQLIKIKDGHNIIRLKLIVE